MSVSGRLVLTASPAVPVVASYWRLVGRRLARDPTTLIAGALLGGIVLAAVLAPALAPYDPAAGSIRSRPTTSLPQQPPTSSSLPSARRRTSRTVTPTFPTFTAR